MRKLSLAMAFALAPLAACNDAPQEEAAPVELTPEQRYENLERTVGLTCNMDPAVREASEADRTASDAFYADRSRANWEAREAAKQAVADARLACREDAFEEAGLGDMYRAKQAPAPAAE